MYIKNKLWVFALLPRQYRGAFHSTVHPRGHVGLWTKNWLTNVKSYTAELNIAHSFWASLLLAK